MRQDNIDHKDGKDTLIDNPSNPNTLKLTSITPSKTKISKFVEEIWKESNKRISSKYSQTLLLQFANALSIKLNNQTSKDKIIETLRNKTKKRKP